VVPSRPTQEVEGDAKSTALARAPYQRVKVEARVGLTSASPVAAAETLASELSVSEMSDGAASASAARPFGLKSARTVRACFFRTSK